MPLLKLKNFFGVNASNCEGWVNGVSRNLARRGFELYTQGGSVNTISTHQRLRPHLGSGLSWKEERAAQDLSDCPLCGE
jgi:hypothetical protein